MEPFVSIILIHYGAPGSTEEVLHAFEKTRFRDTYEIILVDNGSDPPFPANHLRDVHHLRLPVNCGYATACNRGASIARGTHFLFLNNDISFSHDFIHPLLRVCREDSRVGAVGPMLTYADGMFQPSWGRDPGLLAEYMERRVQQGARKRNGRAYRARTRSSARAREVDWVTGAAMLVPRPVFEMVGGFDEEFFFYFEDVDLCRRIRNVGYRVRFEPTACLTHFGGGSQGGETDPALRKAYRAGQLRFYALHRGLVSFLLLKLYLLCTLPRERPHEDQLSASHSLHDLVLSFPFRTVRKEKRRCRSPMDS
ncbi:MAG: glycosyltransferase [Bacteroidota bacterium]|nr:glycosyltransferase [Bacteroidota bacterium]